MYVLIWVAGLLRRRPGRVVGQTVGVALAVALLGALGTFFAAMRAQMTQRASAAVPVDWQVELTPGSDPASATKLITSTPGVGAALEVGYAPTPGFSTVTGKTVQTTGPGQVLGLPRDYPSTFPGEIRFLVGRRHGTLLAQQTAANLHAGVGSVVTIERPGLTSVQRRVTGIVDLTAADSLFQAIGVSPGAGPAAPPDNVMLLGAKSWRALFSQDGRPVTGAHTQIHVDLAADLPPDPGAAFAQVTVRANNLEARLSGQGLVGNNLGAKLDAARADAVYAQLLFLFLGLPGVLLASVVAAALAASGGERRRREQALLRVRGASPAQIVTLAAAEALLVGSFGVALGIGAAALIGRVAFPAARFGASTSQATAWFLAAALVGMALALLIIVVPAWRDARRLSVRSAQMSLAHRGAPLWARLKLDWLCLCAGGLVYLQAVRSGYQVVLAPEGVPTMSVSYLTLLAPFLLWLGAALLSWRLGTWVLSAGRALLTRVVSPIAHSLSGVVAASLSRQRRLLARGLAVMAIATSFALAVAIFDTTYAAQARTDAELTNGADVSVQTIAAAGLAQDLPTVVGRLPGVAAVQAMQHRFAYVGNDLQDLFGIDATTIATATNMSDAFFASGDAARTLADLARTPDGILVSAETVHDFQLQPGDLIRIRLQSARDHAYHAVPFHYIGIVREFPTAPSDSFLVANSSYVARRTSSPAYQTLLVRTTTSPPAVARAIRRLVGPSGATVKDIVAQRRITLSGLTAIDLEGLTRVELSFAVALAAAGSGLVLWLGLSERLRTFAIAAALGARRRQLAAFVWSEAAFVTTGGIVLGAATGWAISLVIVKILTGVFDPPPEHLSVPWGYIVGVVTASLAAAVAAAIATLRTTSQRALGAIKDL